MRTYTFHHYGQNPNVPSGMTFVDCPDDDQAIREAGRVLIRQALSCVEVCDVKREVGSVKWDRTQGEMVVKLAQ